MPRIAIHAVPLLALSLAIPAVHASPLQDRLVVDLEWGAAWQDRNDVQSPHSASGTRFGLDGLTGRGPASAPRVELSWRLNARDDLRLVAAPLRLDGQGMLGSPVQFEGASFSSGKTSGIYRFDSYRATWRRTVLESPDWTVKAGVTGKIRDAEITLRQGTTSASRTDTGFVPLLHVHVQRQLGERARLQFDGDGLASPRGRAFDLSLRYVHDFQRGLSGFAGVRVLDGGADNDNIYNFARFHYVTVGLSLKRF